MSHPETVSMTFEVTDQDTAVAVGSGSLPVLGTPRLLAWLEAATCASLVPLLPEGSTSVGTREELLSDEGRTRNRLGALFPPDADLVPLVVYICTRVAPVAQSLPA